MPISATQLDSAVHAPTRLRLPDCQADVIGNNVMPCRRVERPAQTGCVERLAPLILGDVKGAPANMPEQGLGGGEDSVAPGHLGDTAMRRRLLFREVVDVVFVNLVAVV